MRPSQKSGRSRGKGNRPKGQGHSPNRVYESAGPEGKVRGTPQQIIDKYQTLARDAQLSGDRVTAENFLQHAEHYCRILVSVQEAQAERQAQQQQQQNNSSNGQQNGQSHADGDQSTANAGGGERPEGGDRRQRGGDRSRRAADPSEVEQPSTDGLGAIDAAQETPALVETPESKADRPAPRPRRPRPKPKADAPEASSEASSDAPPQEAAE